MILVLIIVAVVFWLQERYADASRAAAVCPAVPLALRLAPARFL